MKTEIICALIAVLGVALSAFVSWFTARFAAKAEIQRLQTVWTHEKEAANEEAFDTMIKSVNRYVKDTSLDAFRDAQDSVILYRSKATGQLARLVDELDPLILRGTPDRAAVTAKLEQILNCKRGTWALKASTKYIAMKGEFSPIPP